MNAVPAPLRPVRPAPVALPPALAALVVALSATAMSPAAQAQASAGKPAAAKAAACPALLDQKVPRLQDEKPQDLCQYAGKVLLVVNTASYCGFTSQYEDLEKLHARYAARGLVVMGFPSNDFRQEDSDRGKIADLCFNTYGVRFPMFTPVSVRGAGAHPLFAALARDTGAQPSWNFNKYLVGRDGRPIAHYGSMTSPTGSTLTAAIEKALAAN